MKILLINSVCGIRSTGKIAAETAESYIKDGHECRIAYGREQVPEKYREISYRIGTELGVKWNGLQARISDGEGFGAKRATKKFINWANQYNPDVLWLHNLHGYYLNIELLFQWIKSRPQMQVKWTLHDCWAFTGHCAHFSYVNCDHWKRNCGQCCQTGMYPKSLFRDASAENHRRKKAAFCGVKNMTLITPSRWLADLVQDSFLNDYPIEVVHNKIDQMAFRPTFSSFREKMGLTNKKIVLGVATAWNQRKGLADFIEISEGLVDSYAVVLVGVDKRLQKKLPKSIICLPSTNSKRELAEIYTAADVFINPSKEETFGLTTVEALSCGTPAVVYRDTACEEIALLYGGIVAERSVQEMMNKIYEICEARSETD